jgi:hypothetical protein
MSRQPSHLTLQTPPQAANRPASGLASVTVLGASFVTYDFTPRARAGGSGGQATVWVSDSSVVAQTAGGVGLGRDVVITIGNFLATLTGGFSMDGPSLTSVGSQYVRNGLPVGGSSLSAFGANFATYDSTLRIRVGGSGGEATVWKSDTGLLCKYAESVGATHDVVVTVGVCGPVGG